MCDSAAKLYRPRNPEASPFYKLVRDHFDEFECLYDERFQPKYGYWRPAIRSAMDKFLKCGDQREGFARVRCPDCGKEFFVAFSCKQRCCCPSCDQKRALLLGMRLTEEAFAPVGHRQWVLPMPKRLRLFFRNDRRLLGYYLSKMKIGWRTEDDVLDFFDPWKNQNSHQFWGVFHQSR